MTTRIYTFTGTGNSLWAARTLAATLGGATLTSVVRALASRDLRPAEERVGLVCPVYMYRLPHLVVRFLEQVELPGPLFVVVTCGGDIGDLFVKVREQLSARSVRLSAGLSVQMPSNYIPFGGAPDDATLGAIHDAARQRLEEVARIVAAGTEQVEPRRSRFRAWVHPGLLYRLGYHYAAMTDRSYRVDERCNGCGTCVRVCPVDNIVLADGRPRWQQRCEQCMACLQWCPREAIEFKDKSRGERRYHHPEVKIREMFDQKGC